MEVSEYDSAVHSFNESLRVCGKVRTSEKNKIEFSTYVLDIYILKIKKSLA